MFRLDRFFTLHFIGPLWRRIPVKGIRIPILMYHSISDDLETGHPYFWINTKPALFSEHMRFLYENDYKVVPLSKVVEVIREEKSKVGIPNCVSNVRSDEHIIKGKINYPPNRSKKSNKQEFQRYVVLTFDDGYLDFYTAAFPILRQYGYSATVFLPTEYVGNSISGLRGKKHLTWDMIRELSQSGIDFGSHTCSHLQLYKLSQNEIELELKESKKTIENKVIKCDIKGAITLIRNKNNTQGYPNHQLSSSNSKSKSTIQSLNHATSFPVNVGSFCYPYRFPEEDRLFTNKFKDILLKLGYVSCATTRIGSVNASDDLPYLKRLPVNSGNDLAFLSAILSGQYDWLYGIQLVKKYVCKLFHYKHYNS